MREYGSSPWNFGRPSSLIIRRFKSKSWTSHLRHLRMPEKRAGSCGDSRALFGLEVVAEGSKLSFKP